MKTTLTVKYFNEFFDEYRRIKILNEESLYSFLKRLVEVWEPQVGKPFYEFSRDEIFDIYSGLQLYSAEALYNYNALLRNFANWLCDKVGLDIVPVYNEISKAHLRDCVRPDDRREQLLAKEDLYECIEAVYNYTDKAILLLLFEGAGGVNLTELTFASESSLDLKNRKIVLGKNKVINLTEQECIMVQRGFKEDQLAAFSENIKFINVTPIGLYKRRANVRYGNEDINNRNDQMRRYRFISRRLQLMSNDLGIPLNCRILWDSGLVYYFKKGMEQSGLTFEQFLHTEEARQIGLRYNITSKVVYVQLLKERLSKYFK